MPTGTATVTADTGPDIANTAVVLSNVAKVVLDIARQVITFHLVSGAIREFDLAAATTVTDTLSGAAGNHTIVVS